MRHYSTRRCGRDQRDEIGAASTFGCIELKTHRKPSVVVGRAADRWRGQVAGDTSNWAALLYACRGSAAHYESRAANTCPPPKLLCCGTDPPRVTLIAQYLNSGIFANGSSAALVSLLIAAS